MLLLQEVPWVFSLKLWVGHSPKRWHKQHHNDQILSIRPIKTNDFTSEWHEIGQIEITESSKILIYCFCSNFIYLEMQPWVERPTPCWLGSKLIDACSGVGEAHNDFSSTILLYTVPVSQGETCTELFGTISSSGSSPAPLWLHPEEESGDCLRVAKNLLCTALSSARTALSGENNDPIHKCHL